MGRAGPSHIHSLESHPRGLAAASPKKIWGCFQLQVIETLKKQSLKLVSPSLLWTLGQVILSLFIHILHRPRVSVGLELSPSPTHGMTETADIYAPGSGGQKSKINVPGLVFPLDPGAGSLLPPSASGGSLQPLQFLGFWLCYSSASILTWSSLSLSFLLWGPLWPW